MMDVEDVALEPVASISENIEHLADIYQSEFNIAVWQRHLDTSVAESISTMLGQAERLKVEDDVTPENVEEVLTKKLFQHEGVELLIRDISNIVDMFCCLFEQKRVGLRLTMLEKAMCPRFHTDKVPCRLVTTYQGLATEWLKHSDVDRSKLGAGNNGLPDDQSGIYQSPTDIQHLKAGDVALLKGEQWIGNEGLGLVHRSPGVLSGEKRLLLTLDFIA